MTLQIGILYSRIRKDEKLLLSELRERDHEVIKIDVRKQEFDVGAVPEAFADLDLVVDRCLATSRSLYATTFFESYGVPVVNSHETADTCADKVKNSLALEGAGVPTPETSVAFTKETAMDAIEDFGYPCVLKPVVGSWGRLMAKIDSPDAAEAILEHKATLGHYEHKVFYVQEYVEKPGRDIRVLATDGEPVAAMVRSSDHWITNAAKGAETDVFELDDEAQELVRKASDAVGGGLLGVDLMETEDVSESHSEGSQTESGQRYTVHEVNHTVEFKALDEAVETDVASAVVDWLEKKAGADDDQLEVTV
ncbi:lysine biosynthesis protein LysX [Halobiforma nitratireducens]|uniref:lysine biosynthesis protein LysX n=1 Tax=Halobiforma nitratireducens TaxID=130048 RepID=UPI00067762BA|nr:lysine biosynthesis protein LysX [Halobiforma nitratireducens]